MGMGDSVGYLSGKFGWIRATDEQVTGVQAQGDRGALEHPLHLLAVLDHRSDMWMEHRAHTVLGGNGIYPIQVGQQGGPTLLVQRGAGVIAGEPTVGGEHQRARTSGRIPLQNLDHVPQRVVIGAVEQQRGEPADRVQPVSGQQVGHRFR